MPITETGYQPYTEDELYDALRTRFEEQFNTDVTPGDLVDELIRSEASVLAEFQEEMVSRVYDAAFIELAEGDELTMKAKELGIIRQDAVPATGVARFSRDTATEQDYTIGVETKVQTDEADPIEFETTEEVILRYIDGFEDGSLDNAYTNDTGEASVVSTHSYKGSYELKLAATSDALIYRDDYEVARGSRVHARNYLDSGAVAETVFGLQDTSNYYQIQIDEANNTAKLQKVDGGTESDLDTLSATVPSAEYLHIDLNWKVNDTIDVTINKENGDTIGSLLVEGENTYTSGYIGFKSGDASAAKFWDEVTMQAVSAPMEAIEGGNQTNLPAGSVTIIPNGVTGLQEVANPIPTGNDDYDLIDGTRQTRGFDEEDDEDLRERALGSLSGGGQATRGAIYTSVSNIDDVVSLSVFTNKSSTDNTGSGGLPPYSSEVVVLGGSKDDIVERLYDTMSFIDFLRLYGGAHGTKETYDVYDETVDETFTGEISRPPEVSLEATVDVVYDAENYAGKSAIEEAIVSYVGGTDERGEPVIGLGVGDDVYESEVRVAVNDVPGVKGITNLVLDTDGDGNDDTTTDSDGLSIIDVNDEEVAQVDVSADAVTINETKAS